MIALKAAVMVLIGYLSGSVSYAVIFTRAIARTDIRAIGNKNAGTMNVLRSVGKGPGVLVGVLDGLKSLLPMLLARLLWFREASAVHFFIVLAVGIAALVGHWKPVFFGFKGGRGVGCIVGIFLFMIPFEFLISFLIGGVIVVVFIRGVKYRLGRWVPIMFVLITPFLTLALNFLVELRISVHYSLGGHQWYVLVGVFATSLSMLLINLTFMGRRVDELKGEEAED